MKLEGKKVTVVGLGRSGFAAAKFLLERRAHVSATDGSEKTGVLENAGYPKLSMFWVWPVMGVVWGLHSSLRVALNK